MNVQEKVGWAFIKHIGKILAFIGIAVISAVFLMFAVYGIPTDRMLENAKKSIDLLEAEGNSAQMILGYRSTTLDNYTDAWMLRIAFYQGDESAWDKALHNYFNYRADGRRADDNVCGSTIDYLQNMEAEMVTDSYSRYWHGYLLILKPLLFFFDYGDIRQILKICSLFLVLYFCVLLGRKRLNWVFLSFGAMLIYLEFSTIGMSMQYTWVFLIAMTTAVLILKKYNQCEGNTHNWMFLLVGCLTSFFDFLTYPLFTLAFPLGVLCLSSSQNEGRGQKETEGSFLKYVAKSVVHWGIGYIGMWVGKWVCLDIFFKTGAIRDGIVNLIERSGRGNETYAFSRVIRENLWVIMKWPYLLCAVLVLGIFVFGVKEKKRLCPELVVVYCGIALLPIAWYFISLNHSFIHAFMTYKELSITVFAGSLAVLELKKAWNWGMDNKKSLISKRLL